MTPNELVLRLALTSPYSSDTICYWVGLCTSAGLTVEQVKEFVDKNNVLALPYLVAAIPLLNNANESPLPK